MLTAELIVHCAQSRKESRGLHFSVDYPQTLPVAVDTVLVPPRHRPRKMAAAGSKP